MGASGARSPESGVEVVEHAEALALPSAVHWLPLQLAEPLAENFKFRSAFSASAHFSRFPPWSTYCPSQKIAPFGSLHWMSQPPFTSAWHLTPSNFAWQSIWHFAEAFAWHEPEHEPEHFALQSALGGVPLHWALHLPLQLPLQCAVQSACAVPPPAVPSHCALQSVPQVASQLPEQL